MYIINDFQLQSVHSATYLFNDSKAAKIPSHHLINILEALQQQKHKEISEEDLEVLAAKFQLPLEQVKKVLINQLDILRPLAQRKFHNIYLNVDDSLVGELLFDTFKKSYHTTVVAEDFTDYEKASLVIFYRNNYSSPSFKALYQHLPDDVYLVTAGIIHNILVIDNLYFNGSGLPTHISNVHQLMAFLSSNLPATKDNWLLFYRSLVKNNVDTFPEPCINTCQQGFIAYTLYQFASQFTEFWKAQTPMDKVNWFWHADLTSFSVHQEVAVHSAFSEYDMNLNLECLKQPESV